MILGDVMNLPQVTVFCGAGRYKVELTAIVTAEGYSITLTGGEKPHVGGVVMCLFDQSIQKVQMAAEFSGPGHKDTVAAELVARLICQQTGENTVVVCGIHIDKASAAEIKILLQNSEQAANQAIIALTKLKKRDNDA